MLEDTLKKAVGLGASDIMIIAGLPVTYKINGMLERQGAARLIPEDTKSLCGEVYRLASGRSMEQLLRTGDDDFSFSVPGLARFRVNALKQRGSLGLIIRVVTFELPDRKSLGIPDAVIELTRRPRGLVLVTGTAGSGKSTTLACMVDEVNRTRNTHIITIEDPIEFLHQHKMSIVTQREVSTDTQSYDVALRSALRESPDIILLGEMRDAETIRAAMTAAETGHLVISTMHTMGAAGSIDRIVDAFPPPQQHQIRTQLAQVLEGVVSQQLLPGTDGGLVPVFEIMSVSPAIRNMIREGKNHQLDAAIASDSGMQSMDRAILALVREGRVERSEALSRAADTAWLEKRLAGQSF
ncbi:MAG: type IV pilus twitching motility protein PilT [Candidatus Heteroscillospira sp.]